MRSSVYVGLVLAAAASLWAEDTTVFVAKTRRYLQNSVAAPAPQADGAGFRVRAGASGMSFFEPISGAQIQFPNGSTKPVPKVADGNYAIEASFATDAALTAAYPNGSYLFSATLNILGASKAHVAVGAGTYPATARIVNFDEIKSVDAVNDFTLQWSSFSDAQDGDSIALKIVEAGTGAVVVDETGIDPSNTDWVISGGSLENGKSYAAALTFQRLATSLPEAGDILPGVAIYGVETDFAIAAAGTPPVDDTTPPALASVVPENGAMMSSIYAPVLFQFSEAMDKAKMSIQWRATVNGSEAALDVSQIHGFWSDDSLSLIATYGVLGGWPSGLVVEWTLNPAAGGANNFRDRAGNELPKTTGTFITAGGVAPCFAPAPGGPAGSLFGIFKRLNYLQTGSDTPALDPDLAAQAYGFFKLPESTPVQTIVTLKAPTDNPFQFHLKVFTPPQGATSLVFRDFTEPFATRSDLDVAYPAGTYAMELRNSSAQATNSAALVIPATGYPTIPKVANFAACQTIATNAVFAVQWAALSPATGGEFLSFRIFDATTNLVFQAPDPCGEIALAPTATSIDLPAGLLAGNSHFVGELSFSRLVATNKTLAGVAGAGYAALTRIVRFPMQTTDGSVTLAPPEILSTARSGRNISLTFSCMPGRALTVEAAANLKAVPPFSTLLVTNPPASPVTLVFPATESLQIFRGQQQ
jgi:hypothetical protein